MEFCALCSNLIDKDPVTLDGEQFHRECLLADDDLGPLVQVIKEELAATDHLSTGLFLAPSIPKSKLLKALDSYAKNVLEDRVLALYDCGLTLDQESRFGFIVSSAGFYSRHPISYDKFSVRFGEVRSLNLSRDDQGVATRLTIQKETGTQELLSGVVPSLKLDVISRLLEKAQALKKDRLIDDADNLVVVSAMAEPVKLSYLKLVINMLHQVSKKVTGEAVAELEVLMAQAGLSSESRIGVRDHLLAPTEKAGRLLYELEGVSPKGSQKGIRISLLKDLLRFHRLAMPQAAWTENPFIRALQTLFGFSDDVVGLMEWAIENDAMIIDSKTDDADMAENARRFSTRSDNLGVPTAAVYLTGSTAGIEALGTVLGLAGLRLGDPLKLATLVSAEGGLLPEKGPGTPKKDGTNIQILGDDFEQKKRLIAEKIKTNERVVLNIAQDISHYSSELMASLKAQDFQIKDAEARAEKISRAAAIMNFLIQSNFQLGALNFIEMAS